MKTRTRDGVAGCRRVRPLLSAGSAALALLAALSACDLRAPEYEIVEPRGEVLELRVPADSPPSALFFTYRYRDRNINFFLRRDRNGVLRSHFDACYSCFKYKRGYVAGEGRVTCRACRIAYDLDEPVWDFVGPCVPITLSSKAESDTVRIERSDLEKGARFF